VRLTFQILCGTMFSILKVQEKMINLNFLIDSVNSINNKKYIKYPPGGVVL